MTPNDTIKQIYELKSKYGWDSEKIKGVSKKWADICQRQERKS